jgi:hypothetical protein
VERAFGLAGKSDATGPAKRAKGMIKASIVTSKASIPGIHQGK